MINFETISKDGDREYNEDYVKVSVSEKGGCFVLADGLGGHGGGDEASKLVVQQVIEMYENAELIDDDFLGKCFQTAQDKLIKLQIDLERESEMKTTMVVLIIDDNVIRWGHIGDSRLYCFKNNEYETRTLDHSVPQMLVAAGEISEKEIRGHSDRNRLLRVMGTEWDRPRYEIAKPINFEGKKKFLMCSDGFWELIVEKDMIKTLKKSKTPKIWIERMEEIVLKNGKNKNKDNYSAIAVWVDKE